MILPPAREISALSFYGRVAINPPAAGRITSQRQEAAQGIVDDILSALGTMRAAIEQPTTVAPLARLS
jgi:hypothetical protein